MAIDPPLKRKRGRPPGSKSTKSRIGGPPGSKSTKSRIGRPLGAQSDKSKMEQKMALVKQRLALLDSASSSSCSESDQDDEFQPVVLHCGDTDDEDDAIPLKALKSRRLDSEQKKLPTAPQHTMPKTSLLRKRGRPPGSKSTKSRIGRLPGAQSDKSKMEQKKALVKQRLALLDSASSSICSESDQDDEFQPAVLDCGDTDDEDDAIPLKALKSRRLDSEQKKLPSAPQAHNAQNIITGITNFAEASDINGQNISASVHGNCGSAMDRAKEVQAKLPTEHPSLIKNMLQSHVIRGFWLGLPAGFCNKYLPKQDTGIMLEDENGEEHHTMYLGYKQGLSAGWRGFAIKHDIKVGDVVVFQLVESTKFKVYIIRDNQFTATDGAISLLNLEARKKGKLPSREERSDAAEATRVEHSVPADDKIVVSEAMGGLRISDSEVDFGDVTSFSDFSIIVDRLVIDCKFHEHLRRTYYELCRSQKAFLHRHLLKHLNLTLVVGAIMETVSIAEGIRAARSVPSSEDLLVWKKTLESVALLGMDVGFLLRRVDDLLVLSAEAQQARDLSERQEAEKARAAEKVKALELALGTVKDALKKMDVDMEEVEARVKRSGTKLQELATAPW